MFIPDSRVCICICIIKSCIMGQPRPSIGAINFEVFFMSLVIWHQKSFQKLLHKTAIAAAQYFDRRRITECNFWQKMKVAVAKVIVHKYKWYFVTKIVLTYCEKNFWNSRLKAENLKFFLRSLNNFFKQRKARTMFGNRMFF